MMSKTNQINRRQMLVAAGTAAAAAAVASEAGAAPVSTRWDYDCDILVVGSGAAAGAAGATDAAGRGTAAAAAAAGCCWNTAYAVDVALEACSRTSCFCAAERATEELRRWAIMDLTSTRALKVAISLAAMSAVVRALDEAMKVDMRNPDESR